MRVVGAALETLIPLCSPAAWLSLFISFCESCLVALIFCTDCRADWTHCEHSNMGHLLNNRLLTWRKMENILSHSRTAKSSILFCLPSVLLAKKKTQIWSKRFYGSSLPIRVQEKNQLRYLTGPRTYQLRICHKLAALKNIPAIPVICNFLEWTHIPLEKQRGER